MALKIYGIAFSPFVARVMLAASAKGMKYTVEMPKDGMKCADFLKISPFGKIPAITDGTTTLYESGVIVEYLDAKSKTAPLIPKSAKAAAAVRLTAAVAGEYVQGVGLNLFRHWRNKNTDTANLDNLKIELDKGLDALERVMTKGKYAGGAKITIADAYVAPALFFVVHTGVLAGLAAPLGKRKKLNAYWKGMQKDKLVRSILDAMNVRLTQMVAEAS